MIDITLKIKIKDIELELTEEEAQELFGALEKLIGKEEKIKIIERYRDYWPTYPYITWDNNKPTYDDQPFTVYSGDTVRVDMKVNQGEAI